MPKAGSAKTASAPKNLHPNHRVETSVSEVIYLDADEPKRKNTLRVITFSLVITVVLGFGIGLYLQHNRKNQVVSCSDNRLPQYETIIVGDVQLAAEVAQSNAEKQQGLSGRNCLDDGAAMLFTYEVTGDYCFWMKDMKFPIDVVWLNDDKEVVTIQSNASPDSYPGEFCPSRPAQYIVEVQAGLAKRLGWQNGTQFQF